MDMFDGPVDIKIGLAHAALRDAASSIIMEAIAYGIYVPLFIGSIRALCSSLKATATRRLLLLTSVLLFLLITSHWTLQALHTFNGAKGYNEIIEQDLPIPVYPPFSLVYRGNSWLARETIYILATLLVDCVLMYRLFIVWSRNRFVIVFPILTCIALVAVFISSDTPVGRLLFIPYILTIATNVYVTAMISLRIWRHNRSVGSIGALSLKNVVITLLESAGLYTLAVIIALVWVNAQELQIPVMGISFSLLIIMVARSRSRMARDTADMEFPTAIVLANMSPSQRTSADEVTVA